MSKRNPLPELDFEHARWTTDEAARPILVVPVEHLRPGTEALLDKHLNEWLLDGAARILHGLQGSCSNGEISVWESVTPSGRSQLADIDPGGLRRVLKKSVGLALGIEDATADIDGMDRLVGRLNEWNIIESAAEALSWRKRKGVQPQPTGAIELPPLESSSRR